MVRPFFNDEAGQFEWGELRASDALLLGRKTYEGLAPAWPSMTDGAGFADRMNSMPKYVVASTLDRCDCSGSQLLTGDVAEKVRTLKKEPGRDFLLSGSAQLFNMLKQKDLIDLYLLMVHPILLGKGRRLFAEGTDENALTLTLCRRSVPASSFSSTSRPRRRRFRRRQADAEAGDGQTQQDRAR